jgi:putative heme-binding domain-containing protein
VWALVALRRVDLSDEKWVRALLDDGDPDVRFECLRWIADAVMTSFRAEVEELLTDESLDYRLFEAVLATWNTLRGEPGAGVTNPDVLVERITNPTTPAKLKGFALRLAPPTHKQLTIPLLRELFEAGDSALSLEVVRTLAARNADDARVVLAEIAVSESQPVESRAEAVAGLASSGSSAHQALLVRLADDGNAILRGEARRALRFTPADKYFSPGQERPAFDNASAWLSRLDALAGKPDPEAGRRLFFHSKVALCATCHRHSGRGNVVGPDLSLVSQQGNRLAILRSILEPQREVAPQFYPIMLKLKDGTDFMGILLRSSSTDVFRDLTGKERTFQKADIVERTELKTSLMPPGLVASLSDEELRDLLAFLTGG